MISALAAGNAQGWGSEFPPTTFTSTEYGEETFLMHRSTPCKGRNMCIIIDCDECNETVYQSFLEKNCNRTTFEKGLELRADVEHAVTAEFELLRSKGVNLAISEAMKRHHANPDHVFNSKEHLETHSQAMTEYWSDPKNRVAHRERMSDVPSGFFPNKSERLSDVPSGFFSNKPQTKQHTRNHWKQFGILRKPYQCDKCGHQYQGECSRMLQHKENCKHTTAVLISSAQLLLVELPGNSPKTVKEDSESEKNEEDRTHERRLRFSNDCKRFNFLLENHPYHKMESRKRMNMLQKNKFRQQIDFEISEGHATKKNYNNKLVIKMFVF